MFALQQHKKQGIAHKLKNKYENNMKSAFARISNISQGCLMLDLTTDSYLAFQELINHA